jgi:hypothetical protein
VVSQSLAAKSRRSWTAAKGRERRAALTVKESAVIDRRSRGENESLAFQRRNG